MLLYINWIGNAKILNLSESQCGQICLDISNFVNIPEQSATLRALRAKNVLTCQRALRACVLTCQRAFRAYVLTFQRPLRAYVLTCQRALRAQVLMCLACLRAHVPECLTFLRAHMLRASFDAIFSVLLAAKVARTIGKVQEF